MAILDKLSLKARFETGDIPTQGDFFDLIDSTYNANQTVALQGDVSGSAQIDANDTFTLSTTLSNTGVVPGSYTKVTVDSKGRVTNGAQTTTADDFSANTLTLGGNIVPVNANQTIGTPTSRFSAIYVDEAHLATNTLYIGDVPVIGTTADNIIVKADPDQSLTLQTSGVGQTNIISTDGVQISTSGLNSNVKIQASGAGSQINFGATQAATITAPTTTVTGNFSVSGATTFNGDVTFNGTNTIVNTTSVTASDNIIEINKGEVGSGVTAGAAGIRIDRGQLPDVNFVWDETTDQFKMGVMGSEVAVASQQYVDGIGSVKVNANAPIIANTGTKITYDSKGLVTSSTSLSSTDIPALDWSKITTGKPSTLAGYGITDAALLTHDHDAAYAPFAKGVTNGDAHDHNGGDGAQIDHGNLSNRGTNTHTQIDTALTRLANTSGANTGDETAATIKTKLGITTISGVNTGDQDLSGYVEKTGSIADIANRDHGSLTSIGTNSHTQIDTALTRLSNTYGSNTGDETATTIKTKLGITTLSGSNTGDQDLSGYVEKSGSIADISNHDHSALSGIGTNTHAQIDTALTRLVGTSGSNTGDETAATIKTKLGITTLSGVNTGDQDLSGYVEKTGSIADIANRDHADLSGIGVNTHAQIDTALTRLTNTSGTNTGDETAATIKTKLGIVTLSGANTGDQDLSGLVPKTTTVNGHALSDSISLGAADVGLGAVTNDAQVKRIEMGVANGVATLDAEGRLSSDQLPAAITGAVVYKGVWNASSNLPALADGIGTQGWYYKVSVGGSTNLDGNTNWYAGDMAIFNGTTWDRIDGGSTEVISVAGRVGAVTLTTADVAASTNKRYVTDTQATVIGNTSGVNTGDETADTIKTKLGITTISGVNTGDQDLSGLVPKTTTVNGHALSGSISLGAADVGLGNVANVDTTDAANITSGVLAAARIPTLNQNTTGTASTITGSIAQSQVTNLTTDLAAKAPLVSPSFTTPTLGAATATTVNKVTITAPTTGATLTIANGATLTASASATVSGTNTGDETAATIKSKLGISTLSGSNTGDQTITLTGDVTGSGTGSFAATIASGAVTLGKMAALDANSIMGNNTASPATPVAMTATQAKTLLGITQSDVSGLTTALAAKAPLASPALTGTPTAPTAAVNTNTTQLATTAFVLAQAGSAVPAVNGTATAGTSTYFARQDHVHGTDTSRAPLASPTFTGTVTAPTFSATSGFSGNLTGNVTGNVSGSSGSCTGNAATATNAANAFSVTSTGAYIYHSSADTTPVVVMNSDGSYYGQIGRTGTQLWSLGYGAGTGQATTPVLTWGSNGQVTVTGTLTVGGSFARSAAGKGYLNGNYPNVETSGTSGCIYTIGDAYAPGTTTLGNMYGIGYGLSGYAGIGATGAPSSKWGMYVAAAGVSKIFLNGTDGTGYFDGSIYSAGYQVVTANSGTWAISVSGSAASASSSPLLSALGNYVWSASTGVASYATGIQCSFVASAQGWPSYGSVLTMKSYSGGGGSLQLYVPYGSGNGGTSLRYRMADYNASNAWTELKTILDSDNYSSYSPTLTGAGASGTWGISVTGNAATVTTLTASQIFSAITNQYFGDWFRTTGATGWYNNTYGTGIYPIGTQLISTYNNSGFKAEYYQGAVVGSSYGSMKVIGTTGGYAGVYLSSAAGTVAGMFDVSGNGGDYDPTTGWHFYWNRTHACLGIGGSTTAAGYKMYVNGSGYVNGNLYVNGLISGTAGSVVVNYNNTSNAAYQMLFGSGNYVYGSAAITMNPYTGTINAAAFNTSSKRELKENIQPFEQSALAIINATKIVGYNYKADESKTPRVGFIADDTNPIIAGVNQDQFDLANTVGVLMKAVQELTAEIERLKAER